MRALLTKDFIPDNGQSETFFKGAEMKALTERRGTMEKLGRAEKRGTEGSRLNL